MYEMTAKISVFYITPNTKLFEHDNNMMIVGVPCWLRYGCIHDRYYNVTCALCTCVYNTKNKYIVVVRLACFHPNIFMKHANPLRKRMREYWIDWRRCDWIRWNIWMQMRINKLWIIWTTICVSRAHFITIFLSHRMDRTPSQDI